HGRRCLTLTAEMASPTDPVTACQRALAEWGTIDILVNSAGIANVAPARRFAEPVEIADAALYLASDASSMVNGALLMVEGGFTSV
ncbi:MAG: SDR family oxidoreductase, partial [Tabrizicola sp.]|nr:SDR family oxidoreductase [Tabrizicola sp.]